jgi:hypothetical protein
MVCAWRSYRQKIDALRVQCNVYTESMIGCAISLRATGVYFRLMESNQAERLAL